MILCDFNMISIMTLMSWYSKNYPNKITNTDAAAVIVDNLAYYKSCFSKFGNMVLACDSRSYWRKNVFPHYKVKRKQSRQSTANSLTNVDWDVIHSSMDLIKTMELWNSLHHIVEVEGAEADDIIAVLCQQFAMKEDIVILSSDKDFVQLQSFNTPSKNRVTQFNPQFNRWVSVPDPAAFTREHIIRGDSGDSIPNFMSPDHTVVSGQRNKSINKTKLQEWVQETNYLLFCDTPAKKAGYERNRQLIDFNYIPPAIKEAILIEYYGNEPNV